MSVVKIGVVKQYQLYHHSPKNAFGADEYVDTSRIGSIHIKQVEITEDRSEESKEYFKTMLGIFEDCQNGDRIDRLEMYRDVSSGKELVFYVHLRDGKVLNTKTEYTQIKEV